MSRIFISYARENASFVQALYNPLQRVYKNIWYDKGLIAGEDWWTSILDQISRSEIFVIVLSEHWLQSEYGRKEYDEAVRKGKKILPIRIDKSNTPQFLSSIQYVDVGSETLNLDNLTEIHAAVVLLTDEIVSSQKRFANNLLRATVAFGVIFVLLAAIMVSVVATQFPPFPGEISYISRNGVNYEIQEMAGGLSGLFQNIFNPGPMRLPDIKVSEDSKFAISPDGSKIAFASRIGGNQDIYIADRDGSNVMQLTKDSGNNLSPSWSDDGSQLVFASDRDANWEIYRMNSDGSEQVNLTNTEGDDQYPDWSPTTDYIAFMSNRDGNWEIYRMNSDGSEPLNLTNNPGDDQHPDWSIDGRDIVFASNRLISSSPLDDLGLLETTLNPCNSDTFDIYVTDVNGVELRWVVQGRDDDVNPSWSPDGRYIVFSSDRSGDFDLYFIPITDNSITPILLTNDGFEDDFFPIWSS